MKLIPCVFILSPLTINKWNSRMFTGIIESLCEIKSINEIKKGNSKYPAPVAMKREWWSA